MIGAIAGDIIGSVYEAIGIKTTEFPLFDPACRYTDDTVLTVAVADCILNDGDVAEYFHDYFHTYPHAVYGGSFIAWALERSTAPYNSWGNGSAMRVSPVGFACETLEDVLRLAQRSAEVTHNHPEGIRGAQATAAAVFLARTGQSKPEIHRYVQREFGYDLDRRLDDIRPNYEFDVSCQGSVPESIIAFLESNDYEDAVRKAISLGGDADTMACIAGGIAEAYYSGIPEEIERRVWELLDDRLTQVAQAFVQRFGRSGL